MPAGKENVSHRPASRIGQKKCEEVSTYTLDMNVDVSDNYKLFSAITTQVAGMMEQISKQMCEFEAMRDEKAEKDSERLMAAIQGCSPAQGQTHKGEISLNTRLEARPGIEFQKDGIDYYQPGDQGTVTELNDASDPDRFHVTWDRTNRTSGMLHSEHHHWCKIIGEGAQDQTIIDADNIKMESLQLQIAGPLQQLKKSSSDMRGWLDGLQNVQGLLGKHADECGCKKCPALKTCPKLRPETLDNASQPSLTSVMVAIMDMKGELHAKLDSHHDAIECLKKKTDSARVLDLKLGNYNQICDDAAKLQVGAPHRNPVEKGLYTPESGLGKVPRDDITSSRSRTSLTTRSVPDRTLESGIKKTDSDKITFTMDRTQLPTRALSTPAPKDVLTLKLLQNSSSSRPSASISGRAETTSSLTWTQSDKPSRTRTNASVSGTNENTPPSWSRASLTSNQTTPLKRACTLSGMKNGSSASPPEKKKLDFSCSNRASSAPSLRLPSNSTEDGFSCSCGFTCGTESALSRHLMKSPDCTLKRVAISY